MLTRTLYWFAHEPCWFVRKKNAPWYGKAGENSTVWESPSPKFIMGASDEPKFDHPTQKPVELMRRPILNHTKRGELVYEPFLGSGTTLAAAELTERICLGIELDPKYVRRRGATLATAHEPRGNARRRRADVRRDQSRTSRSRRMNRALPPRDRGNRVADSLRASRFGGIVPRLVGLVGGIADSSQREPLMGRPLRTSLARDVGRFLRRWARRVALFALLCVLVPLPLRGRAIQITSLKAEEQAKGTL